MDGGWEWGSGAEPKSMGILFKKISRGKIWLSQTVRGCVFLNEPTAALSGEMSCKYGQWKIIHLLKKPSHSTFIFLVKQHDVPKVFSHNSLVKGMIYEIRILLKKSRSFWITKGYYSTEILSSTSTKAAAWSSLLLHSYFLQMGSLTWSTEECSKTYCK